MMTQPQFEHTSLPNDLNVHTDATVPRAYQVVNACMAYRHDWALLPLEQREEIAADAVRWHAAWNVGGVPT